MIVKLISRRPTTGAVGVLDPWDPQRGTLGTAAGWSPAASRTSSAQGLGAVLDGDDIDDLLGTVA